MEHKNKQKSSLTVSSIICRGSTLAIIGFVIASNHTDNSFGRIMGMIIGYVLGTLLKKCYIDNH